MIPFRKGAIRAIKACRTVYLETFTSPVADMSYLEELNPNIVHAKRWMVEDGRHILDSAEGHDTAVVSYGDPLVATTHSDLLVRAASRGIPVCVIHASSAIPSMVGRCGLHHYKMGRMATIMNDTKSLTTPYYTTYRNLSQGGHTILLLEYDQDNDFFLDPVTALSMMLDAEAGQMREVFTPDTFCIVASRIGMDDQGVVAGRISNIISYDGLGEPPHSIIVPGRLHFTERDAIISLVKCLDEPPPEGYSIRTIPQQMIDKYTPMILQSISEVRQISDTHMDIVDNAKLYLEDARTRLEEGQDEVAILNMGYADGLIDALRILQGMEPKM